MKKKTVVYEAIHYGHFAICPCPPCHSSSVYTIIAFMCSLSMPWKQLVKASDLQDSKSCTHRHYCTSVALSRGHAHTCQMGALMHLCGTIKRPCTHVPDGGTIAPPMSLSKAGKTVCITLLVNRTLLGCQGMKETKCFVFYRA